jgi:hypothetical protein
LWMLKQYLISSAYAEQKKNNHWHKWTSCGQTMNLK